jgi:hypothetical protein
MNNVLASGYSRYNNTNNTYINLEGYESTIIGKFAGTNLIGNTQYYNSFIGYKAGEFSTSTLENIFIGWKAGANIITGSNNIVLGRQDKTNINIENINNIISLGFDNIIRENNAITIGMNNSNSGENSANLGNYNNVLGKSTIILGSLNNNNNISCNIINSSILGNNNNFRNSDEDNYNVLLLGSDNNLKGNDITVLGSNNTFNNINNSLIIGNNNIVYSSNVNSNIIIIGNDNSLSDSNQLKSEPILLGYNLYNSSNVIINIGNTILKYSDFNSNEILSLGNGKNDNILPVAIGYNTSNIIEPLNEKNKHSLYINNGIYTDKVTFGSNNNFSKGTITLLNNSNLINSANSNITYTLPILPIFSASNMFLSTNKNGELYWNSIDVNNVIKNTDELKEGTSNNYYSYNKFENDFNTKINNIFPQYFNNEIIKKNLDDITNGTFNKYIRNGIYNQDLLVYGTLTVNKLQVLGLDIKNDGPVSYTVLQDRISELERLLSNAVQRIVKLEALIKS